jgi:hypothetical protein
MNWNRRIATLAGLALLALTNGVALGGAAWNRSGEPDATLALTQRELRPPYVRTDGHEGEDSGLSLHLRWRTLPSPSPRRPQPGLASEGGAFPAWLDAAKMRALGFPEFGEKRNPPQDFGTRARWQPTRAVLIVLELDGPARQEALRRAEAHVANVEATSPNAADRTSAREMLERERANSSRLFAVDAGLDAATLRATYPDRTKYAIVHGRIDPRSYRKEQEARGAIQSMDVENVNVPLAWRGVFDGLRPTWDDHEDTPATHFQATLAFGHRFEPWLASAARR